MSTLKVINLQHPSYAGNNVVLDSNGNMTVAGTVVGGSSLAMRNRIINGDMRIDQRNNGSANTISSNGYYIIDRWKNNVSSDGGSHSCQQMNGSDSSASNYEAGSTPAGFTNSMKLKVVTANASPGAATNVSFYQWMEGLNVNDLDFGKSTAKTVTLSFWVKSSVTGLYTATVGNLGSTRVNPQSYTINSANTWEYKTITYTGDTTGTWKTDNTGGIYIQYWLCPISGNQTSTAGWNGGTAYTITGQANWNASVNNTFYITGVQFEVGTTATPFERRFFHTELQLCQRYYQKFAAETGLSQGYFGMMGNGYSSTLFQLLYNGIVPFRAKPVASYSGTINVLQGSSLSGAVTPNGTVDNAVWLGSSGINAGVMSCQIQLTGTSIPTGIGSVLLNSSGAWLALSAEL